MNLIFLPGASGNTAFWKPVMDQLTSFDQKNVIAYPSFGGFPDHVDIQNFNDLQTYVLNQIQEPAIIIAQSMGGIFAVQAALQKIDQIKALVLVATSGGINLTPFDVADWRGEYQKNFQVPDWFITHSEFSDTRLGEIKCPVLLIWGNSDPISPVSVGRYLHEKLSNSKLIVIENGQHDLAYIYSAQVSSIIQSFLENIL